MESAACSSYVTGVGPRRSAVEQHCSGDDGFVPQSPDAKHPPHAVSNASQQQSQQCRPHAARPRACGGDGDSSPVCTRISSRRGRHAVRGGRASRTRTCAPGKGGSFGAVLLDHHPPPPTSMCTAQQRRLTARAHSSAASKSGKLISGLRHTRVSS